MVEAGSSDFKREVLSRSGSRNKDIPPARTGCGMSFKEKNRGDKEIEGD